MTVATALALYIHTSSTFPFYPSLSPLQEESLTFQGQLDSLEAEILKHREELHNMQVMNNDAQLSKEAAKVTCDLLCYELTSCMFLAKASEDPFTHHYCQHWWYMLEESQVKAATMAFEVLIHPLSFHFDADVQHARADTKPASSLYTVQRNKVTVLLSLFLFSIQTYLDEGDLYMTAFYVNKKSL